MAILFEWYENPVAPNQPQEETKLNARITLNGKTGTDRLRRKIQERCSLTETDVSAVLDALSHAAYPLEVTSCHHVVLAEVDGQSAVYFFIR